jgi:clan AA aspartic protease (TIGR02281 family)
MRKRTRIAGRVLALVTLFVLASGPVCAEIYRWTDAAGNIRFTHDLGRVPLDQRPGAKQKLDELKARRAIQTYDAKPVPARPAPRSARKSGSPTGTRIHEIRVEKNGTSLRVMVRLNDELNVPFLIDTGASDVVVPHWAAKQLGIRTEGPGIRTQRYGTANGVIEDAVFTLGSVSLGTARAENVAASVSRTMKFGLLGLSFFQHFDYRVNPGTGVVTLVENELEEDGLIRGGRSEAQWRSQFSGVRRRLEQAEVEVENIPFGRQRKRDRAQQGVAKYLAHLEILEGEADDAHVPFSWRE